MLRWIGLAVLGIIIAAAISIAASRLASQQIGLASEPISAGEALAPGSGGNQGRRHPSQATRTGGERTTPKAQAPSPAPAPSGEPSEPTAPRSTETPTQPEHVDDSGSSEGGEPGGGADD